VQTTEVNPALAREEQERMRKKESRTTVESGKREFGNECWAALMMLMQPLDHLYRSKT